MKIKSVLFASSISMGIILSSTVMAAQPGNPGRGAPGMGPGAAGMAAMAPGAMAPNAGRQPGQLPPGLAGMANLPPGLAGMATLPAGLVTGGGMAPAPTAP